jgi:N-acetylmuramate 1-kinase
MSPNLNPRFPEISFPSAERAALFEAWFNALGAFNLDAASVQSASSDASFRRYFRVTNKAGTSYIIMDAPPEKENSEPFVAIAKRLLAAEVNVPALHSVDLERGFMLLGDLGGETFLQGLQAVPERQQTLYRQAVGELIRVQHTDVQGLPEYDHTRLMTEMRLLPEWYLKLHLQYPLSEAENALLESSFERICARNLAEARVFVHRDFHSRNLMMAASGDRLGVLDFQDAVQGPITYDLVSLLRDAYYELPEAEQLDLAARYWEAARAARLPVPAAFDVFYEDFEWMGLQRALKVLGIFARLAHRDGKDGYLKDIPLVAANALRVCQRYDSLKPLGALIVKANRIAAPQVASFSPQ